MPPKKAAAAKKVSAAKKAPIRRQAPKVTSEPVLPAGGPTAAVERDLRVAPKLGAAAATLGEPGSVSATDVYERRDIDGLDRWFLVATAGLPIPR